MKAIIASVGTGAEGPDVFRCADLPLPEPGKRDLLVRLTAIGMNPVDTKARRNFKEEGVLGWDGWGVVEKTGQEVGDFKPGDRVFYAGDITRSGTNAEFHLVDHRIAARAPKRLSPEDAVAMPLTAITAWETLFDRLELIPEPGANKGGRILIIGGAGGVGSIATQLARWAGLGVYATASRPETAAWCERMGASRVLNHKNPLDKELARAGMDDVETIFCTTDLDTHWRAMAEMIRPQGRIAFIDDPSGPLDLTLFKPKSVRLCWEFMYTRSMFQTSDMAEQGRLLARMARLLDRGDLVTTRQKTYHGLTPGNIQAMHLAQEGGTMMGKQVLVL